MAPKDAKNRGPGLGPMLNLERVPMLAPKFANKLGKTASGFAVKYDTEGISVEVSSLLNAKGVLEQSLLKEPDVVGLIEYERRVALHNTPTESERLASLKRKYELRLMEEFPSSGPVSGTEQDIQAWLGTLPFEKRIALLKSQKDFDKSFPDGFRKKT